jgi:RHS repeat-associated protein
MAYRYDSTGELVEAWDRARGRTQYTYDPIGQLLAMVPEKARAEVFRYDATGNLCEAGEGAEERVYGRGNRLLRKGDTEYRWDDDGRLVERKWREAASGKEEVWRYAWDAAGLLKQVERPDGVCVDFVYDPFARRVSKRVTRAGATRFDRAAVMETRFVWDGDVLVHEIRATAREGGNPVVEERTYHFEDDGFEPLAHREKRRDDVGCEQGGWFLYVNDPIGTPEWLVGSDGAVACELRRSAWGQTEVRPGNRTSTPIRFQGQYEDEETGLAYNRWRYFDVCTQQYCSRDPLGLVGGWRSFAYARNPIGWTDPFGLAARGPLANLPKISTQHDSIAHGGYFSRKAQRALAHHAKVEDPRRKHTRARSCEEAKEISSQGPKPAAQYDPAVDNKAIERAAIAKGTVTSGDPIQTALAGGAGKVTTTYNPELGTIGFDRGQAATSVHAEFASGTIHGHPRNR